MQAWLERRSRPLHAALALATVGAFAVSPWLKMAQRLPRDPGWANAAHVALGSTALVLALSYLLYCTAGGRWRLHYGWTAGRFEALTRDLSGLARGRLPAVEGGGLWAAVEGLLLLAMLTAAASGTGWLLVQGSDAALDWSYWHGRLAWAAGVMLVLHVAGVALHLLDFVRD